MCIPPRARANVLGIVNAMASAIVVYFMVVSFVVYIGDNRTLTIKLFFSAIAFLGPYPNAWRSSDSVSAGCDAKVF
jgi:uncharacterized membrane protein YkgB